jgi:thioredoxin 1
MSQPTKTTTQISKVIQLNSQNFQTEVLDFQGIVLVDFYADWCGPCKMLAPELEMLSEELVDNKVVKIAKLNTEDNIELAIKYQIQGIPNVIIFNKGEIATQIVGLRRKDDYKKIILEELLKG